MKTRLSFKALTCFLMLFSAQVLFAAEYIITKSELIAQGKESSDFTIQGFHFVGENGTANVPARIWTDGLRTYAGNILTITAPNDELITAIEFTNGEKMNWSSSNGQNIVEINPCIKATVSQIRILTNGEDTENVASPSLSAEEGIYQNPFELTITAEEGAIIKYTTDDTEPSLNNGEVYSSPITIDKTTTIKAVAIKGDLVSSVTKATYTFITLEGNGSLEKPYTLNDIKYLNAGTEGWFTGTILGSYENGGNIASKPINSNWAIGTGDDIIPVQLGAGPLRNAVNIVDNSSFIGKEVSFYGTKERYFDTDNGIKGTNQVFGLYDLNITEAGYSTYYANHAFVVPTGVEIGIVTNASTANATLTIDWSAYKEGEIVPANTGVLLKGNEGTYSYIVDDSEAKTPAENLLKGSVAEATTEGENCLFYKLSYDNNGENLGFYWAAENGAAFTNGAHKAYLALPTEIAKNTRGFGLEGDGTTGIDQIVNGQALVNVYTIDGILVRKQVLEDQALNGLKKGIYIVNGKKVIK